MVVYWELVGGASTSQKICCACGTAYGETVALRLVVSISKGLTGPTAPSDYAENMNAWNAWCTWAGNILAPPVAFLPGKQGLICQGQVKPQL